jgi:protein SCO1/2
MKTQTTCSIQKIVMLVVFLSTALISSLFVFHFQHQRSSVLVDTNKGIIFAEGRTIKPFELLGINHQKFTEKNLLGHWTLLFFGFTHCSEICPGTMDKIKNVYQTLHPNFPTVQVVFVSLDPEHDSLSMTEKYAQSFHPDFIGRTGLIQNIHKLQSEFGIFATNNPSQPMMHSGSILLINPANKWIGLFHNDINIKELTKAITNIISTTYV